MSPNASHRVRPGLSSAASLMTTLLISFDQEVLNQHLNLVTPEYPFFLEFRVCGARLRQRSLFDRDVYGSWRAADVGFEPLIMRRRRSRAVLYHEQGRFSCGLRARGGRPGYRRTGGQARP